MGVIDLFRRARTFESLGLRDYRLLWLGQFSTSMGQWMDQVARTWLIYAMTNDPLQLGLVSAARGIPLLIFGAVAGVFADRHGRKAQLIIAQTVNALLNVVLATLILTGRIQPWHLYVTGFLAGTVQAFQQPARQVLISDLVGDKHLMNAIALNSAVVNVSRSVGPAVGGILIQAFGVDISYYVQAAMYALATLWTAQIRVPESRTPSIHSGKMEDLSFWHSMKEGFAYIMSQRLILALLALALAPTILGSPYVSLMPIFAIDVFHGGATTQGLLLTMVGVGAIVGALGVASLGQRQGSGRLLVAGAAGFGLSLVLFSRSPALWMALAFAVLAGLCNTSYSTQNQTALQILVPLELRGRVLGVRLLDRGLMPVGSILAGALASLLGGPWAVTLMGASCLVVALGVAVVVPDLWKLDLAAMS